MREVRVGARAEHKRRWDRENLRVACACGRIWWRKGDLKECPACKRGAYLKGIRAMWLEGLTYQELASRLGTTVGTVKSLVVRMRHDGWDMPRRPPGGLRR